jgi:peptidoglycan/xylan/chitin deacetylase (PgdA/CDA1 family)
MIRVAFRLDDPSETSHQGVEEGILDTLYSHKACATFAVIPFRRIEGQRVPLSRSRAAPLIQAARAGVVEPALHGHTHARLQPEMQPPSEFVGRPWGDQHTLILEGRAHLESIFGCPIVGFVPPWNSYDDATIGVLRSQSFSYLSASRAVTSDHRGVPRLLPFTTRPRDLPVAIEEARRFSGSHPVIIVVMHHYDFLESGSEQAAFDLAKFSVVLARLMDDPGIAVCKLADIAEDLNPAARPIYQHQTWARYPRLRRCLPRHSFLNAPVWRAILAGALGR